MKTTRFLLRATTLMLAATTAWAGTDKAPVGKAPTGKAPVGKEPLPPAKAPSRSHFRLSAGVSYRSLGDACFTTGSYSSGLRLPFMAGLPYYGNSPAGGLGGYADRRYRDGFVFLDSGTTANGDTWNWGYNSASQVTTNPSPRRAPRTIVVDPTHSLTYHAFGGAETQSSSDQSYDPSPDWCNDISGAAPVATLDWLYDVKPDLSVGLSLGWMFLGADGSHSTSNFAASQSASANGFEITDRYDIDTLIPPTAPYQGSFNGPGPLIKNIPTQRTVTASGLLAANAVDFANAITESFEIDLHTISVGPTVEKRWGRLSANIGGGLAVNIATWDADYQETLYANGQAIRQWRDHDNDTEFLLGAYIQASVNWQLSPRWNVTAFARYDWSEDFTTNIGPSQFHFDPSGWSVGAKLGFAF